MYIYVCMYVYIYTYIYVCMYVCILYSYHNAILVATGRAHCSILLYIHILKICIAVLNTKSSLRAEIPYFATKNKRKSREN